MDVIDDGGEGASGDAEGNHTDEMEEVEEERGGGGGIVHRASCHRCGNMRKKNVLCPRCPHIFCQKCSEKMVEEHGKKVRICKAGGRV